MAGLSCNMYEKYEYETHTLQNYFTSSDPHRDVYEIYTAFYV